MKQTLVLMLVMGMIGISTLGGTGGCGGGDNGFNPEGVNPSASVDPNDFSGDWYLRDSSCDGVLNTMRITQSGNQAVITIIDSGDSQILKGGEVFLGTIFMLNGLPTLSSSSAGCSGIIESSTDIAAADAKKFGSPAQSVGRFRVIS